MRKLVLSIIMAVGLAVVLPVTAFAATTTVVGGKVTLDKYNYPIVEATVVVNCTGGSRTATTDSTGGYAAYFTAAECPVGSIASVTAYKGKAVGAGAGIVRAGGTNINVATVDVIAVPELGTMTAAAAILGGGAFMLIRRRSHTASHI